MIQEQPASSSNEEDYVRLDDDMERDADLEDEENTKADATEDDDEPPLFSTVFAVDQLRNGALTAASLFSWGIETVKGKAVQLSETEQIQKLLDSTKAQRETLTSNASNLWESTRAQREEITRTATTIGEQVQPHLEKLKQESSKALESLSSVVSEATLGSGGALRSTNSVASGSDPSNDGFRARE